MSSHAAFVSPATCEQGKMYLSSCMFFSVLLVVFYGTARDIFSMSINDSEPEIPPPPFFCHGWVFFVTIWWMPRDIITEDDGG